MRVGLLGAARITPHVVIGPARRRGDVEVVAVAARDPDRARSFAEQHGVPQVEPSYDALLARPDLDLIYNALPNSEHAPWSIRAVEAGRAVLCEKPFASNVEEARRMTDAAARAGRPLLEAFHYRHHALMHDLVERVRNGSLGPLRRARASFIAELPRDDGVRWAPELGGGALLDLGCYAVHALRSLTGEEPEIAEASGVFENGVDAALEGRLVFPSLPDARVACSMIAGRRAAELFIEGELGSIIVNNFVAPQLPHEVTISDAGGTRKMTYDGPGTFDRQLEHVRAVVMDGAAPLTGGADAVANMTAINALYAAARA